MQTLTSEPVLPRKLTISCASACTNQHDDVPSTTAVIDTQHTITAHDAPAASLAAFLAAEANGPVRNGPVDGTGISPSLCSSAKSS